jgi:antitoxin ParD1/3/4
MHSEKLSISLPADMAQMVRKKVESGGYSSNSEVIREALRAWQAREAERERRLDEVRKAIDEAINDPVEYSGDEIREYFDRLYAAEEKANPN